MSQREVARELGLITHDEIGAAQNPQAIEIRGREGELLLPHEALVRSAVRRLQRNERLLVECEGRIRDAGYTAPSWLRP
jgi:hypothetical protein